MLGTARRAEGAAAHVKRSARRLDLCFSTERKVRPDALLPGMKVRRAWLRP
jgi:hypothetical protein